MATALAHRNQGAVDAYSLYLAPHTDGLLYAARRALEELPLAR
ncbi:hypothetical protein [Streptomyces himalayensis]|nr:hypothetical protein [Streptomyces himalayensis]